MAQLFRYKKFYLLGFIFIFLITSGLSCGGDSNTTMGAPESITLEYWRVWDDQSVFFQKFVEYMQIHPNVRIN